MYKEYWGLKELPFENLPDPTFFFRSAGHEEALMRLMYAVESRKGACMLTGPRDAVKPCSAGLLFMSWQIMTNMK